MKGSASDVSVKVTSVALPFFGSALSRLVSCGVRGVDLILAGSLTSVVCGMDECLIAGSCSIFGGGGRSDGRPGSSASFGSDVTLIFFLRPPARR